jgi:hypothetical protein
VTPDEFLCVKVSVGGYMNASFELSELERLPPYTPAPR